MDDDAIEKLKTAKLGDAFYCHARTPEFGFWGELREMIRQDMTLAQAVRFHNANFDFISRPNGGIPFIHEICHQMLAVTAIYNPDFYFLLPAVNPATGHPEPTGYNGVYHAETLAGALEYDMLSIIIAGPIREETDIDISAEAFIGRSPSIWTQNQTLPFPREEYEWMLADRQNRKTSIMEIKRALQFEDFPARNILLKDHYVQLPSSIVCPKPDQFGHIDISSMIGRKNRHGEALPEHPRFNKELGMSLHQSVYPFCARLREKLETERPERTAPYDVAQRLWKQIKVRDMHRLIGGEEAAQAYFKKCEAPVVAAQTRELAPA